MVDTRKSGLRNGLKLISPELGVLQHIFRLPRMDYDPKLVSFGVWPGDSTKVGGFKFSGRSSGCAPNWDNAILTTVGEVVERYCPAFYNRESLVFGSYEQLKERGAFSPREIALYHEKQYEKFDFPIIPFTEKSEVNWVECWDIGCGRKVLYPGSLIYIPWVEEEEWVAVTSSTGMAGHVNEHAAILNGLYENIERDSFTITWMQWLDVPKILIDREIRAYLDEKFPSNFEFHFLDVNLDLGVPAVFGFCFGESDFGKFVAVGSAARSTYADALKKVANEIGQAISYFRYLLGEMPDWVPDDNFDDIMNFEEHSIFYQKRPDLWHVFDRWRFKDAEKKINFYEKRTNTDREEIRRITKLLDDKGYSVLCKDLSTPDVRQAGFCSLRVIVPQLIEMAGSYAHYFSGGRRLYEVPEKLGYLVRDFDQLNPYPHPFP
ncbi:YcaO-like family protein [Neolewinella lacunae]|uniref:YcaO-like family protein n=1 Tax=Neolewinella lacunae TaxID=1517758 RepID=A0A923PMP9_9BACT|nr:YcaO-like family protein [Neolewinella lacunae]MBC6994038.1 YcaO-like family protein [Neolewinella lacunae]MDN3634708.1 YcaO-like family protein [Neolewinella lacunae]